MSVRIVASSVLRTARQGARPAVYSHLPRRTLFGIGSTPQPPATPTTLNEAELAQTQEWAKRTFQNNPEVVDSILNFAKIMEEEGIEISAGKMPGPLQLMKLARNPKFVEAARKTEEECAKAGIDLRSKEMLEQMMKLVNSLPRGP
ncbi:hypothetical protein B0H16DRAFT_1710671 [Mycena metata]|uniref:Uncharacterized protein n=1 Tax=Mycena metata TaxID=1033252 RepID=A0AAD7NZJ8_9AGAR|nr:hypothetical protein B0H16DRAFT_1710671 [Mycena metata]